MNKIYFDKKFNFRYYTQGKQ